MILFVDDEPHYIQSYIDELELAGYEITTCTNVDDALDVFGRRPEDIQLFVVDLMNAPGRRFADIDTQLGRRTGVALFKVLRSLAPSIPIIVLTNVASVNRIVEITSDQNSKCLRKDRLLPFELVDVVAKLIHNNPALR